MFRNKNNSNYNPCPSCSHREMTDEEYRKSVYKTRKNVKILSKYKGILNPIKCECKICGNVWTAKAKNILSSENCMKCKLNNWRRDVNELKIELAQKHKDIKIQIENYVSINDRAKCNCKICGHEWYPIISSLINGYGCPKCANILSLTTQEFKEKLSYINPNISIISEYKNYSTKVKCKCKICGHEWRAKPINLVNMIGCPRCNRSKGERKIEIYLDRNNIEYEEQKTFENLIETGGRHLSYDFYIPSQKLLIEFQGQQHYHI